MSTPLNILQAKTELLEHVPQDWAGYEVVYEQVGTALRAKIYTDKGLSWMAEVQLNKIELVYGMNGLIIRYLDPSGRVMHEQPTDSDTLELYNQIHIVNWLRCAVLPAV